LLFIVWVRSFSRACERILRGPKMEWSRTERGAGVAEIDGAGGRGEDSGLNRLALTATARSNLTFHWLT